MQPTEPAQKRYFCRHIFPGGHRCGAAALRNELFCYWHHTTRRPIHDRAGRRSSHQAKTSFHLEIPEDRSDLQYTIGLVLQRIAANEIDTKRAGLLLYGLQIAALNLQRAEPAKQSERCSRDSVKQPLKPLARSADPVEEIIAHPDLGHLAPETEYLAPVQQKGLAETFLAEWKREQAAETERLANAGNDPVQPAVLPHIQACQQMLSSRPKRSAVEGPAFELAHKHVGSTGTTEQSDRSGRYRAAA